MYRTVEIEELIAKEPFEAIEYNNHTYNFIYLRKIDTLYTTIGVVTQLDFNGTVGDVITYNGSKYKIIRKSVEEILRPEDEDNGNLAYIIIEFTPVDYIYEYRSAYFAFQRQTQGFDDSVTWYMIVDLANDASNYLQRYYDIHLKEFCEKTNSNKDKLPGVYVKRVNKVTNKVKEALQLFKSEKEEDRLRGLRIIINYSYDLWW